MTLNYKKLGEGTQKVVILHGLFGSLDNWMTHGRYLASKGFEVYLVDQRNHGKSPHTAAHDYELMSQDLADFLKEHNIEHPYLIGHSMGGKTVMHYAMHHQHNIKKLVVVDIAPKYYPPHHQQILNAFHSVDVANISSRKEAQESMSVHVSNVGVMQFLLKNLDRTKTGFQWKVNLDVLENEIEKIGSTYEFQTPQDVETLFIRGGNSDYILNEDRSLLKSHFPNSNLVTIRDAGHWVHAEQYENFISVLEHYLNA